MSQSSADGPVGDPWRAFGHVVSGVAVYGVLGWLADRWLGTSYLVAVGIVVGAGLGVYATQASLRAQQQAGQQDRDQHHRDQQPPDQQDD
jgi:F0F1-type ATP synthase assembly protein I